MNGSHIAGAGVGALVGSILVALGQRIGLDLTNFDSVEIGVAAVAFGTGLGHAIGSYGLSGVLSVIWRGRKTSPASAPPAA